MQEKTEAATPRKRKKAREDGQVCRSAELISCAILLAGLYGLRNFGGRMSEESRSYLIHTIAVSRHGSFTPDTLIKLVTDSAGRTGLMVLPFLGVVTAVAFAGNALQVGVHFTPKQAAPKLDRINPVSGLKKLFTSRSLVELAKSAAKVGIVAVSGGTYIWGNMDAMQKLSVSPPGDMVPRIGEMAFGMALRMISTLTVLAALDYGYQRMQYERNLRMTKQEVKDELRDSEGNPEIKVRVRQRMREMARRRMMAEVAKAAVVIMNPTHYAMALKYEIGQKGAPVVVAKGRDLIALKIRDIAEENKVPVVENPPLARALYDAADIGQEIPIAMYRAVAEVLAVVWRLNKQAATR